MNNANANIANEGVFLTGELICPKCGSSNLEELISKSNSIYTYCRQCNYEKNNALKHISIDEILITIKNNLDISIKNSVKSLKIEILQKEKTLSLFVNNIGLLNVEMPEKLTKQDVFFIENTISDMIEDFYDSSEKIDSNVSIRMV